MKTPQNKYRLARWSLAIVWWVVFVCVAQNAGFFQVCSINYSLDTNGYSQETNGYAQVTPVSTPLNTASSLGAQQEDSNLTQECELSKQLLNAHQHQIDDYPLMMFIFALLFIALLMSLPGNFSSFTEPIVPKRRTHLTLCVFRE
ncbi:copper resistance protein [Vibrio kyushuensis]|uniref:copper resistance protein n=1 Tax=Vibrio kyushuensis TaxID=2910249 RepID=UPI003D12659D